VVESPVVEAAGDAGGERQARSIDHIK
jgi:hypothetical protein